jgi:hypothetical protein
MPEETTEGIDMKNEEAREAGTERRRGIRYWVATVLSALEWSLEASRTVRR